MNRRKWLQNSALAVAALGLEGCAATRVARVTPANANPVRQPMLHRPPVDASWDRVIRTTVGLRPHRDQGFLLKAEKLDDKTLIHNYGHGGSGMSLSWGTGLMAAEMALDQDRRQAAVIGCGVAGLTSARQLQRRGFDVTIYAMAVPPDTTSNMSLAGFTPTSGLVESNLRTPAWDTQFRRAATIAYTQLQLLAGPNYGVSWIEDFTLTDNLPQQQSREDALLPAALRTAPVVLQPGEHPFPTKYALQRPTIRIEPNIYLDALIRDFTIFGGHIVIRKFDTPRDLMSLRESVIVNSTGLGARALFNDNDIIPLKGQLTHLVPQPELNYQTNGGAQLSGPGILGVHSMPRRDGIALGGTSERGVWTMEPNEEFRKRIVDAHIQIFSAMKRVG
jgi:D-amino-acid oxidase